MTGEPDVTSAVLDLPSAELDTVFARARRGRPDISVAAVYEPVASASLGIWRIGAGDRTAILKLVAHLARTDEARRLLLGT